MKIRTTTTLLAIVAMAGLALQTQAAQYRFNGAADTAWTNSANWQDYDSTGTPGPPGTNDNARFQSNKTADLDSFTAKIGGLNFRGNSNLGGCVINVNSGGSLISDADGDFAGDNRIGTVTGDATLNVNSGGYASMAGSQVLEVGQANGASGIVNVNTGGTFVAIQKADFGDASTCNGILNVNGGSVIASNDFNIGASAGATGTVTFTSGTMTFDPGATLRLTDNNTAVGQFNMTGGTLDHTNVELQVGRDGLATFTQSGGVINTKGIYIGHLTGGNGTMNMSGGTNTLTHAITLGNQDDNGKGAAMGTLNMSGGWMTCGTLEVAAEVGTVGSMTLSGVDTYLKTSHLRLGDVGVTATSSVMVEDGEFQIHKITSDSDPATESIHLSGGVLKLRHISGATGYSNALDLVDAGVITWTNGALGTLASTRDTELATLTWTNGLGTVLYADTRTNNTHYYYMWAEAEQPVPTFSDWTSDFGMTTNDAYADDYDGDDLDNLSEYALGGNPTNGIVESGILPVSDTALDGGTNWFTYVYNRRTDYVDRGLTYDVENRADLIAGNWTNDYELATGVSAPFTGSLGDEFESVTNRISMEGQSAEFTQLEITISE